MMRVLLVELCSVSRPPPLGSEVSVGWELHHSTQISQRWGWLNTELHLYGQTERRHSLRDRQKRPRRVQTCSTPYAPTPSRTSLPGPYGGASCSSPVQGIRKASLSVLFWGKRLVNLNDLHQRIAKAFTETTRKTGKYDSYFKSYAQILEPFLSKK